MQAGFQKLGNGELNVWKSYYDGVTDSGVSRLNWKMETSNVSSGLFSTLLLMWGGVNFTWPLIDIPFTINIQDLQQCSLLFYQNYLISNIQWGKKETAQRWLAHLRRGARIIGDIIPEIQWELLSLANLKSTTSVYLAILQILHISISLHHRLFLFLKNR